MAQEKKKTAYMQPLICVLPRTGDRLHAQSSVTVTPFFLSPLLLYFTNLLRAYLDVYVSTLIHVC